MLVFIVSTLIDFSFKMHAKGGMKRKAGIKIGGSNWIKISSKKNGYTVLWWVFYDTTLSHIFFYIMILKRHKIAENDGRNDRLNFPNEILCAK